MSPEIEALDQLQGGDLPLSVVASLFPDEAHARRAIAAMLAEGELQLLDAAGAAVPPWQLGNLERQPGSWRADVRYRLAITDVGARRIGGQVYRLPYSESKLTGPDRTFRGASEDLVLVVA